MQIMEAGPEFKSVGSPTIGEPSFATPAYMDGRIYLRTDDHLYCIGEK
jgi:outer membrane protein assembly factor BamB